MDSDKRQTTTLFSQSTVLLLDLFDRMVLYSCSAFACWPFRCVNGVAALLLVGFGFMESHFNGIGHRLSEGVTMKPHLPSDRIRFALFKIQMNDSRRRWANYIIEFPLSSTHPKRLSASDTQLAPTTSPPHKRKSFLLHSFAHSSWIFSRPEMFFRLFLIFDDKLRDKFWHFTKITIEFRAVCLRTPSAQPHFEWRRTMSMTTTSLQCLPQERTRFTFGNNFFRDKWTERI